MTAKAKQSGRNQPPTPLAARAEPPIDPRPREPPRSATVSEREAQGETTPRYAERRRLLPLPDAVNRVAKAGPAEDAAEEVLLALQDGEITARGTPALSFGDRQPIPPGRWVEGTVDWAKGTLRSLPHGYTNITIARADLDRVWPHAGSGEPGIATGGPMANGTMPTPPPDPYRSGAPGKPTIKHLILGEFRRRVQAGDVLPVLADEAKALCDWAAAQHPGAPTPTVRTVENQIRDEFRRTVRGHPTK